MISCVNTNSVQFQTLLQRSGLSEFDLKSECRYFLDTYDRWPNLDELPNSDSSKYLKEALKVNEKGFTKIKDILDFTGKLSIGDAVIELNTQFSDLEIDIIPLVNDAVVRINKRPNVYNLEETEKEKLSNNINMIIVLNTALEKLSKLYGINIIPVNSSDLSSSEFSGLQADLAKGFIYNGNIYLNVDNVTSETLLHEIMHLLFGSIKFTNSELYNSVVKQAEQFKGYYELIEKFPNRTRQDINEELFIQEFAKYLTNQGSLINNLDEKTLYEINYSIRRLLDSILMGKDSVSIEDQSIYMNMTIKDIVDMVNSSIMSDSSDINLDDATLHRTLANMKSELMEQGKLKEYC